MLTAAEMRLSFSEQLRDNIDAAVEALLQRWLAGHTGHLSEIRRISDSETTPMLQKFACFHDRAVLVLKHSHGMAGNELHWTVTPEVATLEFGRATDEVTG